MALTTSGVATALARGKRYLRMHDGLSLSGAAEHLATPVVRRIFFSGLTPEAHQYDKQKLKWDKTKDPSSKPSAA
jgi:hypothetical protein